MNVYETMEHADNVENVELKLTMDKWRFISILNKQEKDLGHVDTS